MTYQAEAGLLDEPAADARSWPIWSAPGAAVSAVLLALRSAAGTHWSSACATHSRRSPRRSPTASRLPGGLLGGGLPAYGIYAARDGHVAVAALEPHFRTRLYAALALPLDVPLAGVMAARTTAEWEAFARAARCSYQRI